MNLLAQSIQIGGGDTPSFGVSGPTGFLLGDYSIGGIVAKAVPFVFAFAGIGLLLMIVAGGFTLMVSAGDAKKMEKGKQTLTNGIIGFLIVFAAFWITQIAGTIFGWPSIFNSFGP